MKRKRLDRYSWRKRGHRRRYTTASVQDGKYSPGVDALIHRHNLRKVRPFARNEPLDRPTLERYKKPSQELQAVQVVRQEIALVLYMSRTFHHRIEEWHCKWLLGRADSLHSVRMLFFGDRALLIRFQDGRLYRSRYVYAGPIIAEREFGIDYHHRGKYLKWVDVDEPLPPSEPDEPPDPTAMDRAPKRMKDFSVKTGEPVYDPPVGFGRIRTDSYIKVAADALPSKPKEKPDAS